MNFINKKKLIVTPSVNETNIVFKYILKNLYKNVLKKVKEKNFLKIFDFGSGYQNLKTINSETYNFEYVDFDPLRNKETIFEVLEKIDNKTIFVALNVFMYLEKDLISEILLFLSKKKIKILLNISKDYFFKKQLFFIFRNYKKNFENTLTYEEQCDLIKKRYNIIEKEKMFFSDIIFCEAKI